MRYGEMKTAFNSIMETLKIDVGVFDFANAIDDALFFLVTNLPSEVLADHVMVDSVDKAPYTPRQIGLPYGFLKPESVRIAKERVKLSSDPDIYGSPIYIPGTIVSPREFLNKTAYSEEPIISFFNGMLNFNPDIPGAEEGFAGSIELVYRKAPSTYIKRFGHTSTGALLDTMDQDASNRNQLTTETLGQSWSDLGITTENLFGGNVILAGGNTIMILDIQYAYDDDGGVFSGLHISSSTSIPFINDTISNVYVMERPKTYTGAETLFVADTDSPDLPEVFHRTALDYAIGKFLLARNPQVATSFMSLVVQTFQSLGVATKIEYGGE